MTNLETNYAGLTLRSPLIIGSSGLTNSAVRNKKWADAGAGAIVLKSLFEEQIAMQNDELLSLSDYPEAADYLQSYVKMNHVDHYLELVRETKEACAIPTIASINCYKSMAWVDFARQIEEAGADAIELNMFYLSADIHVSPTEVLGRYLSMLEKVKQALSIPVIMKIGRMFNNLPSVVHEFSVRGAAGVVLFNRYYQPDIDINSMKVIQGQLFSAPSDLAETLRWTAIVSGRVPDFSIASSTGVHTWEDVVKCLLAGASAVQLCSTLYQHGEEGLTRFLSQLSEWMEKKKYRSLKEFIGILSFSKEDDASIFERSQFMKYYSDRP